MTYDDLKEMTKEQREDLALKLLKECAAEHSGSYCNTPKTYHLKELAEGVEKALNLRRSNERGETSASLYASKAEHSPFWLLPDLFYASRAVRNPFFLKPELRGFNSRMEYTARDCIDSIVSDSIMPLLRAANGIQR